MIAELILALIVAGGATAAPPAPATLQTLATAAAAHAPPAVRDVPLALAEPTYGWRTAVDLAYAEVGTSRATGYSQPGECIMSVQRWVHAGGGAWVGGGDPVSNYAGAERLTADQAVPGDIIQYEWAADPSQWVSGIHTVLVTGVNGDGSLRIVESNNPAGSGLVTANDNWEPQPPAGFEAVAWRF